MGRSISVVGNGAYEPSPTTAPVMLVRCRMTQPSTRALPTYHVGAGSPTRLGHGSSRTPSWMNKPILSAPIHSRASAAIRNLTGTYPIGYRYIVDAVLQALSDPSRRTVLDALSEGPATASELAALLPIARPGASRHLRVLRDAGLVEVHQKGQFRIYSLHPEPLAQLDAWLDRYRSLWTQRMEALHTEIARGKRERRSEQ